MKYLLIDNNKRFRAFLREYISRDNDEIIELDGDQDVSYIYNQFRPDFVLLDMKSGYNIAAPLKSTFPKARIIFISDYADDKFNAKVKEFGAAALVSKENLLELEKLIYSES